MLRFSKFGSLACAILFLCLASPANAAITVVGPDSQASGNLAASAVFTQVGNDLCIVLTNTSTVDAADPSEVLTGVFFNISGSPGLTPLSAVLTTGSTVLFDADGQPAGGVVGAEWGFRSDVPASSGLPTHGISSAGLSPLFGGTLFPGAQLDDPDAVNGVNYGIIPLDDLNPLTNGNNAVTGNNPLVRNSVTFKLSGLGDITYTISDIVFTYGTALGEQQLPEPTPTPEPAPEPTSLAIWCLGMVAAGFGARRMRKQK